MMVWNGEKNLTIAMKESLSLGERNSYDHIEFRNKLLQNSLALDVALCLGQKLFD